MLLFATGKRLEKAVGEEAAQIIIATLEEFTEAQKKEAATKGDLRETELRLQKEIEMVRSDVKSLELRMQAESKSSELRLLKWQLAGFLALGMIMAKGFGWLGF